MLGCEALVWLTLLLGLPTQPWPFWAVGRGLKGLLICKVHHQWVSQAYQIRIGKIKVGVVLPAQAVKEFLNYHS